MKTPDGHEMRIIDAWRENALPWTAAVREGKIESRRAVTDRAIIDAVMGCAPASVLDIGCGEGWLVRALAARGVDVTGVDGIPDLIAEARGAGGGEFRVLSYADIADGRLAARFDVVVCNFSLLGGESVEQVFGSITGLLNPGGTFIVQTLHPQGACGEHPYTDGWREGSWAGCGVGFADPAPWYFRTLASWQQLFGRSSLRLIETREPRHPYTHAITSIIFVAVAAA